MHSSDHDSGVASFVKRDTLREYETLVQAQWKEEKIFEIDAPLESNQEKPKYFATFPYPYMNGKLHIGHMFSFSKAEFAVRYERLKGKNSILPLGFHCTGMPIKACADKIGNEIATFGNPPVFPEGEKTDVKVKSKVAAKSGKFNYQWQIMQASDIPDNEIPNFKDTDHWLHYFPPIAKDDLNYIGANVDWRRSFITTDANPYYDSFAKWQFLKLKEKDRIRFGKRYTIYSPKDDGPCMDHDRQSGEGVLPTEYVIIKQKLLDPYPKIFDSVKDQIKGKNIYIVPATLRPETMFGQTNAWVLPEGDYGAFIINDSDIFICSERAAMNLSYQGYSRVWGKTENILNFKGKDIIGAAIHAPLSRNEKIYIWPMFNVLMTKGTGIVTSVPSDSPHDYVAFTDVKNKKDIREKYGITDEMVDSYELIPIIEMPELGKLGAEKLVKDLKIKSQNDHDLLEKAKEVAYQKGFYEGKMVVEEYEGKLVSEVKDIVKKKLLDSGDAIIYSEPTKKVISRSNDECVVALIDQWFIDYGEEKWRADALRCLDQMTLYSDETRNMFVKSFEWLHGWACSRSYGLGTKIPWDEKYIIDSLSDSTIYMAYYTIAHILHSDIYGKEKGIGGIDASQMTEEVYDYIFLGRELKSDVGIPKETLNLMRREFLYWYPVDIRVSGKDLVPNHLLFWIYNHISIFEDESLWPKAVRANGHVLLNSLKMSKSEGNFISLREGVDRYTADGTRFALADAGDGVDDANFTTETADGAILKIYTLLEWIKEIIDTRNDRLRNDLNEKEDITTEDILSFLNNKDADGPSIDQLNKDTTLSFTDRLFLNEINEIIIKADECYKKTDYKESTKYSFYYLQDKREKYRLRCESENAKMSARLILTWIKTQCIIISPICPHFSEYVWRNILGNKTSILKESWPTHYEIDNDILNQSTYIEKCLHQWRVRKQNYLNPKKKKGQEVVKPEPPTKMIIYISKTLPAWRIKATQMYESLYRENGNKLPEKRALAKALSSDPELKKSIKKVMPIIEVLAREYSEIGEKIFELESSFNEKDLIDSQCLYIKKAVAIETIEFQAVVPDDPELKGQSRLSLPMKPTVDFE